MISKDILENPRRSAVALSVGNQYPPYDIATMNESVGV